MAATDRSMGLAARLPGWSRVPLEALLALAAGLAIGALSGRFGNSQVLLGITMVVVLVAAFAEPRLPLLLVVPAMALSPELDIFGLPLRFEDLVLAPLSFGWLLRVLARRTTWPATPLTAPILAVAGANLFSTLLGALAGTTSLALANYSGLTFWLKEVEVFLLFFITVDTLRTRGEVRAWAYLLAFSGALLALQGMLVHLMAGDPGSFVPDPEGGATYSLMALSLLVITCLAVSLLLLGGRRWRPWLAAALVPLGYSLAFTFSRQAYIGVGAALLTVAYLEQRRALPVVGAVVLAAYLLSPQPVAERASTLLQPLQPGAAGAAFSPEVIQGSVYGIRLRAWERRLPEVLRLNPVTGLGAAALPPGYLDSQYLAQIYYHGLAGLGLFLWLLARTWQAGWRLYRARSPDRTLRALGLALLAATIGLAVAGLGGMPFIAVRSRELFWFLAALAVAAGRRLDGEEAPA